MKEELIRHLLRELPLGASAAASLYCATKNKRKAILVAFLAALAQPTGALIAFIFLKKYLTNRIIGIICALMSGIVAYTALFELFPEALKLEKKHAVFWISAGLLLIPILKLIGGTA